MAGDIITSKSESSALETGLNIENLVVNAIRRDDAISFALMSD